jgi:hypothetical protein
MILSYRYGAQRVAGGETLGVNANIPTALLWFM